MGLYGKWWILTSIVTSSTHDCSKNLTGVVGVNKLWLAPKFISSNMISHEWMAKKTGSMWPVLSQANFPRPMGVGQWLVSQQWVWVVLVPPCLTPNVCVRVYIYIYILFNIYLNYSYNSIFLRIFYYQIQNTCYFISLLNVLLLSYQ